ncbi:MAG: class I SAM-dependent methyltransferase [Dehalococcoidia bacterium]
MNYKILGYQTMQRGYVLYGSGITAHVDRRIATSSTLAAELLLRSVSKVTHYAQGHLLDVGCGESPYQPLFEPYVSAYLRTDEAISRYNPKGIDFYSSALALPIRDESFDTVLCTEVLEHLSDPFKGLHELVRVTKHGGMIILSAPFLYGVHESPCDYFRFTGSCLRAFAHKEKLEIIELTERGGALAVMVNVFVKIAQAVLESKIFRFRVLRLLSKISGFLMVYVPQWFILRLKKDILTHRFTLGHLVVLKKVSTC